MARPGTVTSQALENTLTIRIGWHRWLSDFAAATDRMQITKVVPANDSELATVVLALFARMRSDLQTALVLVEAKRDLAFRSHCRSLVECALHLQAAANDPTYLQRLKEDDDRSRRSRASNFRKTNPDLAHEADMVLKEFLDRLPAKSRKLQLSELEMPLPRLLHVHREISADALHVSLTSIQRHVTTSSGGLHALLVEPNLSEEELEETASVAALSLLAGTQVLLALVPEIKSDGMRDLLSRYKKLYRQGLEKLRKLASTVD